MTRISRVVALALSLTIGGAASLLAQTVGTSGTVIKIDEAAGKITLRHGPIPNLDMDAMTMVFRIRDPAMLKTVKAGDAVVFEAERIDGAITVTRLQRK